MLDGASGVWTWLPYECILTIIISYGSSINYFVKKIKYLISFFFFLKEYIISLVILLLLSDLNRVLKMDNINIGLGGEICCLVYQKYVER
jgi:hypothetical protein